MKKNIGSAPKTFQSHTIEYRVTQVKQTVSW